ncbi:DUF421 domain-containing protein [Neobacillus sp. D3-1R]|uniref:DUF421 domain-containing protein n=1 Tax=Neobacillus sp. D3-1R TaxID=3445778 RepID=UPI003F9FCA59
MAEPVHIIIRTFVFIAFLILITKIVGKKQISEISFFEYVSGITIGSIAGEVIMGLERHIMYGIISILIFGFVTVFVDITSLKSKKFRDLIEGSGTVLIKGGKIQEENLKRERFSTDELASLLRRQNVFKAADVEFAVLEPTGDISVLLKKENRPLTPKDLQLVVAPEKEPQTIIMDGQINNDAMAQAGKTREWLNTELAKLNVTVENVFFGQIDSYGELTVDLYDDQIQVPSPQQRPLLNAMLKKCQADLELFSLETNSESAKKMYTKNAKRVQEAIQKLEPFLN